MSSNETTMVGVNPRRGHDPESIKRGFAEHLKYSLARDRYTATMHDRYLALAQAVRDRLIDRWIETQQTHHDENVKRVYYFSLEFLMGRAMGNNVINMHFEEEVRKAMADLGLKWEDLCEEETDAGLGNGGLGRLAACFLDSLASLQIPAFGYGIRYDYGIFEQKFENGYQVEEPDDWTRGGNPWEIARPDMRIPVYFGGHVEKHQGKSEWVDAIPVIGIPYDTPIVGYGGNTVNTLRLWSAKASEEFDFEDFNQGDYVSSVESKVRAENLTKVLYPNDAFYLGKELRLKQQYFFVACSLHDILRRFRADNNDWAALPEKIAVQMNDTHPSLAVAELMRLLVDVNGLEWDYAWDLTVRSLAYTNHTLLPEALEKWPVEMFEKLLPRHLEIIYEINHQFLQQVAIRYPGDMERLSRMSIIEEGDFKQLRMANLAILGSHSTNGVSAIHTDLLKSRVVPDFADMFPERFNSKTNGITPRRWLLMSNPPLANLITEAIGDKWPGELSELEKLKPMAEDSEFRKKFLDVKRQAKQRLADYASAEYGWTFNPDMMFDVQVKRLHEYKRQLMNALNIAMLYNRLRKGQAGDNFVPRTFMFGAKAAPGYDMAKLIIKLINNLSCTINNDPAVKDKLQVYFLPNYRVSLAEKIIPAADVSEQISLAGTEASGTGNMKFMLNGALTIGTLDGANVEMREEVGDENMFIFGMNAEEAAALKPTYDPMKFYESNQELREALDLIFSGSLCISEPGIFEPIRANLFDKGDYFMLLADFEAYAKAHDEVAELYRNSDEWARKAILNIAASGKFSSDRTISEYAQEIWTAPSCHIDKTVKRSHALEEAQFNGGADYDEDALVR